MKSRIHGLIAILIAFTGFVFANVKLYEVSLPVGMGYSIYLPIMVLFVIGFYCAKCPHTANNTCLHWFMGWIAARLFPAKNPGPYSPVEKWLATLPFLIGTLLPYLWLWRDITFDAVYTLLVIIAVLEIKLFVCQGCANIYCDSCPNKGKD